MIQSIALSASLGGLAGCGGSVPEVAYQTKTVNLANGKTDRVPSLALAAKQRLVWSPTVRRKELETESIDSLEPVQPYAPDRDSPVHS